MLFLESFGNCTELTQRLRVKSVHVLSLVLVIKHSDELACFHLLLSLQNCATCRRLVLLCVSKVPVRCETQWQSCFLHSHSTVSRVVVETTWEGAEHNTGLERTKPHVFCQDKWPAGSYTTRVASGRGFLLLILLYSIPSLPPNSPLYLYWNNGTSGHMASTIFCNLKRTITWSTVRGCVWSRFVPFPFILSFWKLFSLYFRMIISFMNVLYFRTLET
jgi:hypothetical protein